MRREYVNREDLGVTAMDLPYARTSAAVLRHRLCAELDQGSLAPELVDDAALIMSELVTNALLHAAPLPGGVVRACWQQSPDRVELAVTDGGGDSMPEAGMAAAASTGGRGLAIVEALAADWGVVAQTGTVTVWAALAVGAPLGSSAARFIGR